MAMVYENSVSIGPEFFRKCFRDYRDRHWAWAREIVQNGIDAPHSSRIEIRVTYVAPLGATVAEVTNDGDPMSREELVGKLLALGESGKDGSTTSVGGFGKAKEVLYFAHRGYDIHTGDLFLYGAGAGYNLATAPHHLRGTRSTVIWEGDQSRWLVERFRELIAVTQWDGTFSLNGEDLVGRMRKGMRRREFDWGVVYTTREIDGQLVLRSGGIPMFRRNVNAKVGVIVELKGRSTEHLTSNRDGLQARQQDELEQFVTQLSVDRQSALAYQEPKYEFLEGERLRHEKIVADADRAPALLFSDIVRDVEALVVATRPLEPTAVFNASFGRSTANVLPHAFLIKNCTGKVVPVQFRPDQSRFGRGARLLVKWWVGSLMLLHEIHDQHEPWSVGFIHDHERLAEFEDGVHGRTFLVNPADSRWRLRWGRKQAHRLVAVAAHEFVHGLGRGYSYHDEDYASKFTDVMGAVLAHQRRFRRIFR